VQFFFKQPYVEMFKIHSMKNIFNNKKLFITGGTGSFGNSVLDRFLDSNIKEITDYVFSKLGWIIKTM